MKKGIVLSAIAALLFLCSPVRSIADGNCAADLPIDKNSNVDGVLIFRMVGNGWKVLQPTDQLPHTGPVQFVYVAKENWDDERYGVIVIKSGSVSPLSADTQHPNSVFLSRPVSRSDPDNGMCGRIKRFFPRYVSATSYEQYHDLGVTIPASDNDSLTAYHIHYLGRAGACRDSNNTDYDSPLRLDFRSNRSQFSFDDHVVKNGMASQVANSLGFESAVAGPAGLSNSKAEMRRYRTNGDKIACVPFNLNVSGAGFFLRIDDLDGSQQQGFFARTSEKYWTLTP